MTKTRDTRDRRHRFQVHLDPKPFAALQRIHEETGAPVAELIRRAVDAWLDSKGAPKGKRPMKGAA